MNLMAKRKTKKKSADSTDIFGLILRRILGIFLVLSFVGMLWAIYDNIPLIQSTVSQEISLLILLIIPLLLVIVGFVILMPIIFLIVRLASLPFSSMIAEFSFYEQDIGEFTVTLIYSVGFCATLALMVNLFFSLPESVFTNIFEHGLIFVIIPIYLLDFALLVFYYKNVFIHKKPKLKKSLAKIFVFKNVAAFWIISLFAMSLMVGMGCSELIEYVAGSVALFMVFPQVLILGFFLLLTRSYFVWDHPGPAMAWEMFGYVIYSFFVIAGALLGAIAFFVASLS
jgi:hypothetical protein